MNRFPRSIDTKYPSQPSKEDQAELFLSLIQTPLWTMMDDDYLIDDQVITIYQNDRVENALRTLAGNGIMSAPVVDTTGRYVGMISMIELLHFSLGIFDQSARPDRFSVEYLNKKRRFKTALISGIMGRRSGGKNIDVNEDYSLFYALERLCLSKEHRLAVVDDGGYVSGLISHTMIINWLVKNISKMPASLRETKALEIQNFNFINTIRNDAKAIDGLRLLKEQKLSCVAVVDQENRLVNVLSARDLRGIQPNSLTFRFLWNNIDLFKAQVRKAYTEAPSDPIYVTEDSTLEKVLGLMARHKIHQVFVVNNPSDMRPMDVISMADCLQYILDQVKSAF